jgi:hypothetical protein
VKLPGWKHIAGSVWEHINGSRLHVAGTAIVGGSVYYATTWPESAAADRCIRQCGGNRKRGLMLWTISKGGE